LPARQVDRVERAVSAIPASVLKPALSRYDTSSIVLHWVTAALVVALWCLGQTIDWFPKGSARTAARGTHICLGVALALVLSYRIWWRSARGRRLPAVDAGMLSRLSRFVHFTLYFALAATILLGIGNAWVRGDNLFDLLTIPAYDPTDKALRRQVGDLHALLANVLLGLAALHAAAGLTHHFIWKDGVLRRMWPSR